jgi:hypothetical protein
LKLNCDALVLKCDFNFHLQLYPKAERALLVSIFERFTGKTPDYDTCEAIARAFTVGRPRWLHASPPARAYGYCALLENLAAAGGVARLFVVAQYVLFFLNVGPASAWPARCR